MQKSGCSVQLEQQEIRDRSNYEKQMRRRKRYDRSTNFIQFNLKHNWKHAVFLK